MTDYGDVFYDDEYSDPYAEDYGLAGQYYSPEQLMMMEQMLGQGTPSFDQMGMDPQMTAMFGGQQLPQLDTKGREQPYDLGYAAQLMNFGQDMGSSVGNNVMAYMGGPGGYAPGALDPVFDETPLQLSQGPQLQMLAQTGGIRGTLASLILGGMNSGKAAARVRAMLKNPEKYPDVITPEEAADMQGELDLLPADPMNGIAEGPDFNSINKIADDIYKPYLQEQGMLQNPNIRMNADGQYVQVQQRDSPQMEWLKKMGLPDPRAEYDVRYALESDPTLAGMLDQVATTQGDRDMMRTEFEDRLKRIKKYREDDMKNKATDAKQMERFTNATKQALGDYFGAASRGQVERPALPTNATSAIAALDPEVYNAQGLRRESFEEGPGGAPGWLKSLPGNIAEGVTGLPDYASQTLQRVTGRPVAPAGAPRLPTNVGPLPGATTEPATINGITLDLPDRPITSEMREGINPEGYSMIDQIMGGPARDVINYKKTRMVDEAMSPGNAARMYQAQQQAIDKKGVSAMTRYMLGLAPTVVAGRQGRSPRTDAIQQRLAPLFQIGALGRR